MSSLLRNNLALNGPSSLDLKEKLLSVISIPNGVFKWLICNESIELNLEEMTYIHKYLQNYPIPSTDDII